MPGTKTQGKLALLLLALCLAACSSVLPVPPALTATPAPSPSPTAPVFPIDVLNTSWELDYVLVNGERQPAYHEGQCLAVSARPEQYYFYDGCNHGYCDWDENRSAISKGDKYVVCTLTLRGCPEGTPAPGAARQFVKWDKPFHDALMGSPRSEARDGALWLYASTDGNPTLVFRRMAGPCEAQASYLKP